MWGKLWTIGEGLTRRFPQGDEPFQIMILLLQEGGELAQEVNHWEGRGLGTKNMARRTKPS
jgi:hypothetical protein